MADFPFRAVGPMWKPAKGTARTASLAAKAVVLLDEQRAKDDVRKRDGARRCRIVPNCGYLRTFRCETAHLDDKGMGGDPLGICSTPDRMIRSCFQHHQGPFSLHSKHLRVEALTDRGTNGPIRTWARNDRNTEDWYVLLTERAVNVLETAR